MHWYLTSDFEKSESAFSPMCDGAITVDVQPHTVNLHYAYAVNLVLFGRF